MQSKTILYPPSVPEAQFWQSVKECGGTPLIEDIKGDSKNKKVTFVWQDPEIAVDAKEERSVYLVIEPIRFCDETEIPISEKVRLKNIPGTRLYSLSVELPVEMLANYSFYVEPKGINIREMISAAEKSISATTDVAQKKRFAKVIKDEVNKNGKHPDVNNPKRFSHPDPSEGECYSILAMPAAPKNKYVPDSTAQANEQLKKLTDEKRFLEFKIDFSKKAVPPELLYHAGKIDKLFCDEKDFEEKAKQWTDVNKGTNNILLIKNKDKNEWGIFRVNYGSYSMPVSQCNQFCRMKDEPALAKTLRGINTLEEYERNEKKINEDIASLLNERQYYVYLPKNYNDLPSKKPYPLLLQLDGAQYIDLAMPAILEEMMEENSEQSAVVVFSSAVGHRIAEYNCNDIFTEFLANVFVPHLRNTLNVSKEAKDTIITGSSCGGEASLYAAFKHPEIFGNVISQSGALHMGEGRMEEAFAQFIQSAQNVRFVMDAGKYEVGLFEYKVSLLEANRLMKEAMHRNGYADNYSYSEFTGAHSYLCWQASWVHMLEKTFDNMLKATAKDVHKPTFSELQAAYKADEPAQAVAAHNDKTSQVESGGALLQSKSEVVKKLKL